MAKSTGMDELILDAIGRWLVDPVLRKLHGTKAKPGLFLSSAAPAKAAAQRCLELGLIEKRGEQKARGKTESLFGVTPAGVAYVLEHNPVRETLAAARDGVEKLAQATAECQRVLTQVQGQTSMLREVVHEAAARVQPPDVKAMLAAVQQPRTAVAPSGPPAATAAPTAVGPGPELPGELLARLQQHKAQSPLRPMDLPQLFRFARSKQPAVTVGQFHDLLRQMVTAGQIRLSAFTQAMYQLPEPECAMILGREIMYYVERV